jgi:hypothetical protein
MKLNIGKCKELVIDFAKKKHCFPPLTVDEVNIERVKSARILGLTVQDNMKWNEHINNIFKKATILAKIIVDTACVKQNYMYFYRISPTKKIIPLLPPIQCWQII